MAVPTEMTTLNLSGKFVMNKILTDTNKIDKMLSAQGVTWLKRTAVSAATITLTITHSKDEEGTELIDINQTLTGGIPGSRESRIVDWTDRHKEDSMSGHVVSKSRRIKLKDVELSPFLKDDWTDDCIEHGVIQTCASSDTPKSGLTWAANQIWGFEIVGGERKYARHIEFTGPDGDKLETKMFYDYIA